MIIEPCAQKPKIPSLGYGGQSTAKTGHLRPSLRLENKKVLDLPSKGGTSTHGRGLIISCPCGMDMGSGITNTASTIQFGGKKQVLRLYQK